MAAPQVWWSSLLAAELSLQLMLDDTERARLRSLERPADRGRSMVAAALLRVAVGEHLGVAPRDVLLDRTCRQCGQRHGGPRVVGQAGAPSVSVSHSGVLVVVALSTHGAVGVDVQRMADLTAGGDAHAWVHREALVKADAPGAVVQDLQPPLPGYAAALATAGTSSPSPVIRYWRAGPPGPDGSTG